MTSHEQDRTNQPAAAFASAEEIRALQERLLREHVAYAAARSPFYRAMFDTCGARAEEIQTIEDLRRLPLTEKRDLDGRNAELLAAPEEIVDVCLTSATTGERPTPVMQTREDLERLALNEQLAFSTAGLGAGDTLYIAAALDRCFMAGLAYFLGSVRLGARAVRGGSGSAAQHWHIIEATRPTAIVGVPSLMRKIAEFGLDSGAAPQAIGIRKLLAIGEPTRGADLALLPASQALEAMWGAQLFSTYASTELATTFCECPERRGGHLPPELVILEILDEAGRPCAPGQPGEVIVTPLGVRGMPLLRFRTGDVAYFMDEPCACGRNSLRIGPILGRRNQMLKFKGTTVFPTAIVAALEGCAGVIGGFVEAHRNADGTDRVVTRVALRAGETTLERVREEIRAHVRVAPELAELNEVELNRKVYQEGKRKRVVFFDLR